VKVAVLGAGYVGLVTATCLAQSGHNVLVLDVEPAKIDMLRRGESPIYEPGLSEAIGSSVDAGRLRFELMPMSATDAEIVVVAVGTPTTALGAADLSCVRSAVESISTCARPGTTLVMKSTVPPGTGESIKMDQLADTGIRYASNPEFLREGSAMRDWYDTDRIVIGASHPDTFAAMRRLYEEVDAPFVECDIVSAEMIKYASNAFLATKISFINEVASLCDRVGADVEMVALGVGLDPRIGQSFLSAGIGYGGSCFPKDTRALDYLAAANGYDFHLLKAVIEVNARQRMLPMMVLADRLGRLVGTRIAVLGLTFKPDTDDTRESPGVDVARMLVVEGATVVGHDPVGRIESERGISQVATVEGALEGAHACVVAVEWPEYSEIRWPEMAGLMQPGAVVYDGRNCLDRAAIREAGLVYVGVGRSTMAG
jgi:UDPglucose 6-dehydrogenase